MNDICVGAKLIGIMLDLSTFGPFSKNISEVEAEF